MTKAEYLLTLFDKNDGLNQIVRERFNRELTQMFFENKEAFTIETLMELVTDPQFNRNKHGKQLLIIFKELAKAFETNQVEIANENKEQYIPKPRKGFQWWAINESGVACYFENKPTPLTTIFSSKGGVVQDYSFNQKKYDHMYASGKWKSSLMKIEIEGHENYNPNLTEEYPFWAIDKNGMAFYYSQLPHRCTEEHVGKEAILDKNFNSYIYRHMYENEAWKTSLRTIDDL